MVPADPAWFDQLPIAMTVTDENGTIVAMNRCAKEVFASDGGGELIGRSVFDCHQKASQDKMREMLATGKPNHYTITKKGRKKIIHQMPRIHEGRVMGLVEISIPIPPEMDHLDRDAKK